MKIVVAGTMGRFPVGGNAWVHLQYLDGLRRMGHDVVYLEECGDESWVYAWETEEVIDDPAYPARYVEGCMALVGMPERWTYRVADRSLGMGPDAIAAFCEQADLLIVLAVPLARWRPEYERTRTRAFIDLDPGFTQIALVDGDADLARTLDRCDHLFTIGQRIGAGSVAPTGDRRWHRTLPPVSLEQWPVAAIAEPSHFTTVLQWRGFRDVAWQGMLLGQKDREFPRFVALPRHTAQPLRLALTGSTGDDLVAEGWEVVPGWRASLTPGSYRAFIQASRAEISVAKHGYVALAGGWFSDRSVCYLASGRPVLVEDTGLADWLPLGEGVVAFRELDDAVRGIEAINADYPRHRAAARRLAEEVFASGRVLGGLLEVAA